MKFKSRKDLLNTSIIILTIIFLITIVPFIWLDSDIVPTEKFIGSFVIILISAFLAWIYLGTNYTLTDEEIKIKSGPIKFKIKIENISEIIVNATLWVGWKPATALNGIIIKYNRFDEIYISPNTNELFVKEIIKKKSHIKVTYKK